MIKKIFTLLLFVSAGVFAFAQTTYDVTFEVNTANITVSSDGIYLAGGSGFGSPGDNALTDTDNDGVWTITMTLDENFSSHYTFLNGNCGDWSCKENISGQACADPNNFNDRFLDKVTSNMTISTCFGECTSDGSCSAPDTRDIVELPISWDEDTDDVNFARRDEGGVTTTVVESPTETGNMVLKVDKPASAEQWALTIIGDGGMNSAVPFDANNNTITARVWSPNAGTPVLMKMENGSDAGIFVETTQTTTKSGEWEDITFDFTDPKPNNKPIDYNNTYDMLIIGFNFLVDPMSNDYTFYLDDIQFGDEIAEGADPIAVTFKVDMNDYDGDAYTNVNLNGTFNGWCGACATMTDDDMDGIYEITVEMADTGKIEYKFTVDGWTGQEEFNGDEACVYSDGTFHNRGYNVQETATLDAVCWNSCDPCGSTADVTFKVDMNNFEGDAYTKVNLNGTFNGWCGECAEMTDEDTDGVYEITVTLPVDVEVDYKFTLDGWTQQEEFDGTEDCTTTKDGFHNRSYTAMEGGATMDAVCYNSCETCPTSINEFSVNDFTVSPNPSQGVFTVNFTEETSGNIIVFDYQGREVFSNMNGVLNAKTIDLTNEPAGIYLIKVSSNNKVGYKQIILE